MEARSIDYTPGLPGDPGTMMAVGPGWLRARTADMPPLSARWQKWLRLRPDGAEHVASLAGEADVQVETQGRLKAGEIHLWLALTPGAPPTAVPSRLPAGMAGVKPSRMLARSMVEIDVQQLTARTDKLEMWFKHEAAPPVAEVPVVPVAVTGMSDVLRTGEHLFRPRQQVTVHVLAPVPTAGLKRGEVDALAETCRAQIAEKVDAWLDRERS
jgi:hypothetical protein